MALLGEPQVGDPRVGRSDLEQLRGLYRTVAREKRGEIVLLSGERGSGRTTLLRALAGDLRRERPTPTVIAGRFSHDRFEPWPAAPAVKVPLKQIVALVGTVMPLAKEFVQLAEFVGQVIQSSVVGWEAINLLKGQHGTIDGAKGLMELLRAVAARGPVVVLIDDFDEAAGNWWSRFLLDQAAPEITARLPILFVVSLEDAAGGAGRDSSSADGQSQAEAEERESNLAYMLRRLVERYGARQATLPPFGREEIAGWLGRADPAVVDQLQAVTAGNPGRLWELWQDWRERGVVKTSGLIGRWRFAVPLAESSAEATQTLIDQILNGRLERLLGSADRRERDELKDLLGQAALEGREFTVEALARVCGRDRDALVARLEETIVVDRQRPDGLLAQAGDVTIYDPRSGPRRLRRYAFVSELYRSSLLYEQHGVSDDARPQACLELARALADLYSPDERQIARTLARLFRAGGDEDSATRYQRMVDFNPHAHLESLRSQALAIVASPKDDWTRADRIQATALLLQAGWAMLNAYPLQETLTVFDTACELAIQTGIKSDQAWAFYRRSYPRRLLGEYDLASADLRQAEILFSQLGDRRGESGTWYDLGEIDRAHGDYGAARAKYERSLAMQQELGDRREEAATWHALGDVDRAEGDYAGARAKFERSLAMRQELGDRRNEAAAWHALGDVDQAEGDYAGARAKYERALAMEQELGDRWSEAATWHALGMLAAWLGHLAEGARLVGLCYLIDRSIGHGATEQVLATFRELCDELGYAEERRAALLQEVEESYRRDGGQSLLRAAFPEG